MKALMREHQDDLFDTPFERGMAGSERAARRWTAAEKELFVAVITRWPRGSEFTMDDIWAKLPPDFPITKGAAALLNGLARLGLIKNTGEVTISQRTDAHGHGQRLSIWVRR